MSLFLRDARLLGGSSREPGPLSDPPVSGRAVHETKVYLPERLLPSGLRPRSGLAFSFLAVVPAGEFAVSEKFCVNQLHT